MYNRMDGSVGAGDASELQGVTQNADDRYNVFLSEVDRSRRGCFSRWSMPTVCRPGRVSTLWARADSSHPKTESVAI